MANIPPQLQKEFQDFQMMGQQLEMLVQQKSTIEFSITEKDTSIKELEEMEDDVVVYRQIGGILLKKNKSNVLENLKDEKLTLEMRKKTLERSETSMKARFESMQKNLQEKLKPQEN
ncbi:MAG: prefoldin subunit beta [archaeon]|nr:prefoldin subunit beta [archaeon]